MERRKKDLGIEAVVIVSGGLRYIGGAGGGLMWVPEVKDRRTTPDRRVCDQLAEARRLANQGERVPGQPENIKQQTNALRAIRILIELREHRGK